MADPAPKVPTITQDDISSILSAMGENTDPSTIGQYQQMVGQSYDTLVPALLQGSYGGSDAMSALQSAGPVKWLIDNGYVTPSTTGGGDQGGSFTFGGGWRSEGLTGQPIQKGQTTLQQLQQTGAYDPNQDIGTGWLDRMGQVPLVGANPFAAPTIGALDRSNRFTPQQNPSMFGTSIWGPTENPNNMYQNQDWISKYEIPLMELGASAGFGGLGGFTGLGNLGTGIFNTLGNMAIGNTNTAGGLAGIGGSVLGSMLGGANSGLGDIMPYLKAGLGAYKISQNPNNPSSYLSTLGSLAKLFSQGAS